MKTVCIPIALLACLIGTRAVCAHNPVKYLEVMTGTASVAVEHSVDLQTELDAEKASTLLSGPKFFSIAVGCSDSRLSENAAPGNGVPENRACLQWYEIVKPTTKETRKVSVLDPLRGGNDTDLRIGAAEFLLTPAQLLGTGNPLPVPEGLDVYKAYQILDANSLARTVAIAGSAANTTRKVGKPVFLCIPSKEWHHDEFIEASHPTACFVVYELDPQDCTQKVSTLDQFGLNQIEVTSSRWLCVHAALLRNR